MRDSCLTSLTSGHKTANEETPWSATDAWNAHNACTQAKNCHLTKRTSELIFAHNRVRTAKNINALRIACGRTGTIEIQSNYIIRNNTKQQELNHERKYATLLHALS